jgi:hypothetical protein
MTAFDELLGQRVGFCGVDNNTLCLVTPEGERLAFECMEDPCDGYRSHMDEIVRVPIEGHIFFPSTVAILTVERDDSDGEGFSGYRLIAPDGHVWLRFGTANINDYYPGFAFWYDPPKLRV